MTRWTKWIVIAGVILVSVSASGCSTSRSLFNGQDLDGWVEVGSDNAWPVTNGVLACNGQKHSYAWLSTDRMYRDFELELDWRIEPATNAGIFLRAPAREGRISMLGIEVQIKDDHADPDFTDVSAAVFRRIPASGIYSRPVGQWNHYKIRLVGRTLRIELNGQLASETDIDTVTPLDNDSPLSAVPDVGYIGLQNHGQPVEFRNIRIREIR